jgi:hypothetical protein
MLPPAARQPSGDNLGPGDLSLRQKCLEKPQATSVLLGKSESVARIPVTQSSHPPANSA